MVLTSTAPKNESFTVSLPLSADAMDWAVVVVAATVSLVGDGAVVELAKWRNN